ncbi:golgin subfamily B member 1 [Gastrophryne carolinensis]
MFSRLSGLANTVLHELSGDGEGSEYAQEPVPESGTVETISQDQMETLAHYEQLVIQLKELIQQKDAEIQQKCNEVQQKETQLKVEKEASDARVAKIKLQAKAKVATLNKQIEELKKSTTREVTPDEGQDKNLEEKLSTQNHEENTSKLQENIAELTIQLQDSQNKITGLTYQLSESQEIVANLTRQLQDSEENVTDLRRALQESADAARELHKKQETEIHQLQRKLEEQSETLGSRTQVVQMLEQELQNAELQKQVLSEQFREMEQELHSLRQSLDDEQKENTQQIMFYKEQLQEKDTAYQRLQDEMDKERRGTTELEALKAEIEERGKQVQIELEFVKRDLEIERDLRKKMEDSREQLDIKAHDDRELLRADLEREFQEEIQMLRTELDKEKEAQNELAQLRSELEEKERVQEELVILRSELEKSKTLQEEVQQLRTELDEKKETREQLERQLEGLKSKNEQLVERERHVQVAEVSKNEPDDRSLQLENANHELRIGQDDQLELLKLREELQSVKNELEKSHETLLEYEKMKQEFEKQREAQIIVDTLQLETKEHIENISGTQEEDPGIGGLAEQNISIDTEEKVVTDNTNTAGQNAAEKSHEIQAPQTDLKDNALDTQALPSSDNLQELVPLPDQMLQTSVVNEETYSVYQELVVDDGVEDTREKTLSFLMLDIADTQEEINRLKEEITIEQENDSTKNHIDLTDHSNDSEERRDSDVLLLKQQVQELKCQLEFMIAEKENLAIKLKNQIEVGPVDKMCTPEHSLDLEKQKILAEQVNSLENESKSKDVKISSLQKDLDNMNLLLSDQSTLSKLQGTQLEEKTNNILNLTEMLNHSQNKEERLSEALASYECEIISLKERLSLKSAEIETLQNSLAENEKQIAELSVSFSDKMVVLNEEKYSMGQEIKSLKKQISELAQEESDKVDESLEIIQMANAELNLQIELINKEKNGLQEQLQLIQLELGEVNNQLETVSSNYLKSQEAIKQIQEEKERVKTQMQDQNIELAHKQKELEELHLQVENQSRKYNEPHIQFSEKQQSGSDATVEDFKLKQNEGLQLKVEHQKGEIEHLKRKLQAALISRKELTKKVSKLEQEREQSVKVDVTEEHLVIQRNDLKSEDLVVSEKNTTGECLERQLCEKESELQDLRNELHKTNAAKEQLHILLEELRMELNDKVKLIEYSKTEQTLCENSEQEAHLIQLENKIITLEQDKENLQKKVQEALNSRKDTIKIAKEKDRHHREQLKQQKEEFNLLQEKYEMLQKNQTIKDLDSISKEKPMQPEIPHPAEKPHIKVPISVQTSQENSEKSYWGEEWVDFSSEMVENPINDQSPSDETLKIYQAQISLFQDQKNEMEKNVLLLEEKLKESLKEVSCLHDTIDHLTTQLEQEKEKCLVLESQASILKTDLENQKHEMSSFQELKIESIKDELASKNNEVEKLYQDLEESNIALNNANALILKRDEFILSLKSELELKAKEYEENRKTLELQVQEVQQKNEDDVEEEKGKQQLQRKLQAALISRKDALKESKALKLELETIKNDRDDLANRLQIAEGLSGELCIEKETLLTTLSIHKEERDRLIMELDKCLLKNQNLEASCESLKLALEGSTQDKEGLTKELESLRLLQNSTISESNEKVSELQKEYETLLQSYENVSDETERMKRAVETVRQEKQELLAKIKNVEVEKKELEKQLEESEHEIENMKEKMRKFAKSKQQKILELEEENDRLRGELQQTTEVPNPSSVKEEMQKEQHEKLCLENTALKSEMEALNAEKDNLIQERDNLKLQLHQIELDLEEVKNNYTGKIQEAVVYEKEAFETMCMAETQNKEPTEESITTLQSLVQNEGIQQMEKETILQLKELIFELENSIKAKENEIEDFSHSINTFKEEILTLQTTLASSEYKVSLMESEIVDLESKNKKAIHDLSEAKRQMQALEMEKDELEERLMNQMAELNGSIGNFQQDALDFQMKNQSLQRELEYLTFQMEEERRQMKRQKDEALSKVHTEYVEKLKSVHQGGKGKTQTNELQELLKEKQQEVRHLQKDCIHYQETISGLERTIKALEFVHNECEKEKMTSNEKVAKAVEDTKKAQADLTSIRVLLDDTQSEAARILAENLKLKEEIKVVTENTTIMLKRKEDDLGKKLELEREKHIKQTTNLQEKINMLQQEKQQLEASISSLQGLLEEKNLELKGIELNLNQNIANLAAFTRSMCSLQNDRDRVVEESKKWNAKFNEELQKKDNEIRDKENQCTELKDELLNITSEADKLKAQVSRLQLENQELVKSRQSDVENLSKTRDSLLEEKAILSSCLEEEQKMHSACQEDLKLHIQERKDVLRQLEALNNELTQFQSEKENLLGALKKLESEVQDWKLQCEQIQTDLQASKSLTEKLHKELEQKEQDVMQLLSARDEAVNAAVGELNELHAVECKVLQERFEVEEKERKYVQTKLAELKNTLKSHQEDADQTKAQLQAFTKSMCSLQEERERILSDYGQLEQRHVDAILAKDGLIQEAASEGNKLREELRYLRSHNDDLNAQNAKLNAQLTRYREDLKEIISLKDSQLKQLLGEKLQEIEKLQFEQKNQEQLLNQEKGQRDALQQELDETKKEKQGIEQELDSLRHSVSQLQTENEALKNNLKKGEHDVETLKVELLRLQKELENAKEEASKIQIESQQRVQDAEDELNKKLRSIQHDTGILRNETETAEERVAELARDLMQSEQRLLGVQEENASLKAQIQAFGGSMRSLQDSHDIAQVDIRRLQEELNEVTTLNEEMNIVKKERDNLRSMLSESKEEQQQIQTKLNELMSSLQVREEEIHKLTSDFQASQMQLQNMSRAMGSLQEDRDRLQRSLRMPPREIEQTLQSPHLVDPKNISDVRNSSLLEELKGTKAEVETIRSQLGDTLTQVHQKELRIQKLNVKLSQMFEEKNALSLQLRGSNQSLREAVNRCSTLECKLQEMQPRSSETSRSDSAPGAPQEKKEPQTEADQQLMELQQRYLELKRQNDEHEHGSSTMELQLREELQRAEDRIRELEENMSQLRAQEWSVCEEPVVPHELSLLMEPQEATSVKPRSSSLKRLLRLVFCSRTKTPLLASLYLLLIHVLLFLCLTGHL